MPPQSPKLFPETQRSQVWLAITAWLRADPVLSNGVDTWQTWDGSETSTSEPTEENLPLFRIDSAGGTQRWLDESAQECVWMLKISIGVEGTYLPDLLDFWGAIETALFTGNTLLNELQAFQVIQKTITQPAIAERMFGQKSGLAAEGTLQIKMRINS